jgi:hypothetical protein
MSNVAYKSEKGKDLVSSGGQKIKSPNKQLGEELLTF